jgi:ribosome biogenesis protein MAK21
MQFLNLLYKSMKVDSSLERLSAFLKRILQVCLYSDPGFATGAIYLLSQVVESRPETRRLIEDYSQQQQQQQAVKPAKEGEVTSEANSNAYDPLKREPLYSNASKSCCWELVALSSHYHPSVRVCAEKLMSGEKIAMETDPLVDHSVLAFLDKFT